MMEHNTDRLFWTLTSIIVGALLLTLSVKIFPHYTESAIQPLSGLVHQADNATAGFNVNQTSDGGAQVTNTTGPSVITNTDNSQISNQQQALQQQNLNLTNTVNQQQSQLNSLNDIVNNLQNQNNIFNNTVSTLQSKIDSANAKNDDLNTQLNKALQLAKQASNPDNSKIDAIAQQNADLYNQIQTINQQSGIQASQYATALANLNQQLTAVQNQLQTAQNDKEATASQINGLNQQISGLVTTIAQLQAQNQQLSDTVDAVNQNAQTQYANYQNQLGLNQNQLKKLQDQITSNNNLINGLQNQIQNTQNIANNASNAAAQANNTANQANANASNAATQASNANNTANNLSSQVQTNTNNIANNSNAITQANNNASNASSVANNAMNQANANSSAIANNSSAIASNANNIAQANSNANNAVTIANQANNTVNSVQQSLTTLNNAVQQNIQTLNTAMVYRGELSSTGDLNNYTQTGYYSLNYHSPAANTPDQNWIGTLEVINDTHSIVQKWITWEVDPNGNYHVREYIRNQEQGTWNAWSTTQNQNDIAQLQSSVQNIINNSPFTPQGSVASGTSFNNLTTPGSYNLGNQPFSNFGYAYYQGNGLLMNVYASNGAIVQEVISQGDDGVTPTINTRYYSNGNWTRWIKLAAIDDVNKVSNNSVMNRGIASGPLSNNTQVGIYDLSGQWFADGPVTGGYANNTGWGQYWGQMIVYNTGGIVTQEIHMNSGDSWVRAINSWGTTAWIKMSNLNVNS